MANKHLEPNFNQTYEKNPEMFGHPYKELQDYFKKQKRGSILDVGSGQGRDALFLASIGYKVTAIDFSEVGIKQMLEQNNNINGVVADILIYQPDQTYNIILFDMILHGFNQEQRELLLEKFSEVTDTICIVVPDKEDGKKLSDILVAREWTVTDNIEVRDTPKLPGERDDYVFQMIVLKKLH